MDHISLIPIMKELNYAQQFSPFVQYAHRVKQIIRAKSIQCPSVYKLFYEFYGITTPAEAQ